jgi:2-(1,2-epoxy-1,2-dihydrophenyl)acetyl-CoA isomerase
VLDAAEALRWGLVTEVVPHAELDGATEVLAAELASGPTRILGLTKAAVVRGWEGSVEEAYREQASALERARRTEDFREGRQAFIDKRTPTWSGR